MGLFSSIGKALGSVAKVAAPVIGSLTGSPFLSKALSSGLSYLGAREQNDAAMAATEDQMAFQERMSSTALQRMVADARAAGINPMAVVGGGGASTPSGSTYQPQNTAKEAVATALALKQMEATIENTQADTANKKLTGQGIAADLSKKEVLSKGWGTADKVLNNLSSSAKGFSLAQGPALDPWDQKLYNAEAKLRSGNLFEKMASSVVTSARGLRKATRGSANIDTPITEEFLNRKIEPLRVTVYPPKLPRGN